MNWKKLLLNVVLLVVLILFFFATSLFPCKWGSGWEMPVSFQQEEPTTLEPWRTNPWNFCSVTDKFTYDAYPLFFGTTIFFNGLGFVLIIIAILITLITMKINKFYNKLIKNNEV